MQARYLTILLAFSGAALAQTNPPPFRVLAIAEHGGLHQPFVDAAKTWLAHEGARDGFSVDYIENTNTVDEALLARYALFLQLNYPPYAWTPTAARAFRAAIEKGSIGWVGFHHATLLGEFDGYPMWQWFSDFMGGIRFKDYIATFVTGTVHVEAPSHPVMKGLPSTFTIENEEWYTYDRSPRPNVHVLASVDESSYTPATTKKMGDHPVVWTNEHMKARNVYIFMGHQPAHFQNPAFEMLVRNSILWAAAAPSADARPLRVLAFYTKRAEADHVEFAEQAVRFYADAARKHNFTFEATMTWDDLNPQRLKNVDVVLWLNESPGAPAQRTAFEHYMENGGAWIGFHAAGYNDSSTRWPWFVRFLGAVFYGNNWPPLPATLKVDDRASAVTRHLPATFVSPDNEWYSWWPDPRSTPNVRVLLTLAPSNYPIGMKDTIVSGDVPVVWTNTRYRMLYINMGHGDKIFTDPVQNRFFEDALLAIAP